MGGLDDAIRDADARRARDAALADHDGRQAERRCAQFVDLIEDFVGRMNAAGNPGMHWEAVEGRVLK